MPRMLIRTRDSVMFIHIKHGDNEQFLANTNCPLILLLQYMRTKLGLPDSELVDLCDDQGVVKLLFLPQYCQECANRLLPARSSFIFCIVNRNPDDGAYVSITPLVDNPGHTLLDTLQSQAHGLEKARQRQLRHRATKMRSQAKRTQPAKGRGRARRDRPDEEAQQRHLNRRNPKLQGRI